MTNLSNLEEQVKLIIDEAFEYEYVNETEEFLIDKIGNLNEELNYDLAFSIIDTILDQEYNMKFWPSIRLRALLYGIHIVKQSLANVEKDNEDKIEELYSKIWDFMWNYKWILSELPKSSYIDKDTIEEANSFMKEDYSILKFDLAMYYKTLMLQNILMGNLEQAEENYKKWQNNYYEDGDMNDCEACEETEKINYFTFTGDYEQALALAEPILSGDLTCGEVPHIIYGSILKSMVALGQIEEAKKLLPKAEKTIAAKENLIEYMTSLIEVAVKVDDIEYAKKLAEKYEEKILKCVEDLVALKYYIATSYFNEEHYERALLGASTFDDRNGNDYYTTYLANYLGREKRTKKMFR